MRTLQFTPEAQQRLLAIYSYTQRHFGAKQAERYLRLLYAQMEGLCELPNMGKRYQKYRLLHMADHYIVYRAEKQVIYILTVLHIAMDAPAQLTRLLEK